MQRLEVCAHGEKARTSRDFDKKRRWRGVLRVGCSRFRPSQVQDVGPMTTQNGGRQNSLRQGRGSKTRSGLCVFPFPVSLVRLPAVSGIQRNGKAEIEHSGRCSVAEGIAALSPLKCFVWDPDTLVSRENNDRAKHGLFSVRAQGGLDGFGLVGLGSG